MEPRYCKGCQALIPTERLELLPDVEYCTACVDKHTPERVGFMVYSHKTAAEIVLVNSKDTESLRLATRADRRSR